MRRVGIPPGRVAVVSLAGISKAEGRAVAGILGGSFFSRFTVVIDYAGRTVSVYQPKRFVPGTEWTAIPLMREDDLVFARASVTLRAGDAPVAGWYEIDTGGGHALILNAPFVKRHRLAVSNSGTADAMLSIGGGAAAGKGTVAMFAFATRSIQDASTLFVQAGGGLFASDEFDGSIGGALLMQYGVVAFDYSGRRMWTGN